MYTIDTRLQKRVISSFSMVPNKLMHANTLKYID